MNLTIPNPGITVIALNGVEFHVRPENYTDVVASIAEVERDGMSGKYEAIAMASYAIMRRIVDWKGPVLQDGTNAPCTEENKQLFFGRNAGLLNEIAEELAERGSLEAKNSQPSHGGSPGTTRNHAGRASTVSGNDPETPRAKAVGTHGPR